MICRTCFARSACTRSNGVHPLPQLELWQRIDPEGRYRSVYNRYAHVAFVASASGDPRFRLHSQDYVILEIQPNSPEFRALGITHVLVRDEAATDLREAERLRAPRHDRPQPPVPRPVRRK